MKITIEPSDPSLTHYNTVTIDTRSDYESTGEAVDAALDLVVLFGHTKNNVAEAAADYAGRNQKQEAL